MKLIIFLVVITFSGSALAQQAKEQPQSGRYQIVTQPIISGISGLILLDTWTGKTWSFKNAWYPISRLDTSKDVAEWEKANPQAAHDTTRDKVRNFGDTKR
jgi:hypothetical protein